MKDFKRLLVCLSLQAANMGDNSGDCTLYHCNDNITRHLCFNTCKSIGHGVTLSRSSSFFDGIPRVCVKSRDCVTSYPLMLMMCIYMYVLFDFMFFCLFFVSSAMRLLYSVPRFTRRLTTIIIRNSSSSNKVNNVKSIVLPTNLKSRHHLYLSTRIAITAKYTCQEKIPYCFHLLITVSRDRM